MSIDRLLVALALVVASAATSKGEQSPEHPASEHPELDRALFVPCDVYRPAASGADAADTAVDSRLAERWLKQSRAALDRGSVAEALRCAAATLAFEPDNAIARRLLGYRRIETTWGGGYAARLLAMGRRWHPEYGWTTTEQLEKLNQGLRPRGRGWISIDDDARHHAQIEQGWTVRTDNFQVVTNHSRAAAANLAIELESLYLAWLQRFGDFVVDAAELERRWDGREASGYRRQPFQVVYYRTRSEYNAALRKHQPQIDKTLGIYFDFLRQAHFFAGEDQDPGTIRHEAVHQFFQESGKTTRGVASTANAWAVEGVACYFESLEKLTRDAGQRRGDAYRLGGDDAGRLPAARQRRLADGYYIRWADVARLSMVDLQSRPDMPQLYSQIAGLATFCCEYDEGRHRGAFRDLLRQIYSGRDEAGAFAELAGIGYDELDLEYRDYLQSPSQKTQEK